MIKWRSFILALTIDLSIAAAACATDNVEVFYRKNTQVTILTFASGAYEAWSRIVGHYMSRHLAGHPNFIIKMMPGASGLILANYLYNEAPKDGTVIGTFSRNLPSQIVFGLKNVRNDPREFGYIGSPERLPSVVCAAMLDAGVASVEDLNKELLVGASGPATGSSFLPIIINHLVGTKFKVVVGYPAPKDVYLAMRRGEVGGICTGYSDLVAENQDLLSARRLKVLFNFEDRREDFLDGAPSIFDFIGDRESREILILVSSSTEFGHPFVAPPGIPAERLAALRNAFDDAVRDPDLIKDAVTAKLDAKLTQGVDIERSVRALYEIPKLVVDKASAMMPKGAND